MVVLKAFFDDSGTHDTADFAVIGGYISTVAKWDALASEWDLAIREWNLDWFHMTDAEARKSAPYRDWTDDERDKRVGHLAGLVKRYANVGMVHIVPQRLFNEQFLDKFADDPDVKGIITHAYQFSFHQMISWVMDMCEEHKINPTDVELVFADQGKIGRRAREFWRLAWEHYGFSEPIFRPMIGLPPLQAADMLAWRASRNMTRPNEPVPKRHDGLMHRGFAVALPAEVVKHMSDFLGREMDRIDRKWGRGKYAPPQGPQPDSAGG